VSSSWDHRSGIFGGFPVEGWIEKKKKENRSGRGEKEREKIKEKI